MTDDYDPREALTEGMGVRIPPPGGYRDEEPEPKKTFLESIGMDWLTDPFALIIGGSLAFGAFLGFLGGIGTGFALWH